MALSCQLPSAWKVIAFTFNMIFGLVVSQLLGATLDEKTYEKYEKVVIVITMWALSFIMINVGYEFAIDKDNLRAYFMDYMIAMTAAGFPWMFVGAWFFWILNADLPFDESLLIARFAAPTSAGILFSMLDAAGLKDTWVYQKARILAIFDDLDTIVLMIPLKILMVGFKWELLVIVAIMAILLIFSWVYLHQLKLPYSWPWTISYAAIIAAICKIVHHVSEHDLKIEPIHIEVLLPAFVIGTVIDTPCARHELQLQRTMTSILEMRKTSRRSVESSSSVGKGMLFERKQGAFGFDDTEGDDVRVEDDVALREIAETTNTKKSMTPAVSNPPGWVFEVKEVKVGEDCVDKPPVVNPTQNTVALKSPISDNAANLEVTLTPITPITIVNEDEHRAGSKLSAASKKSKTSATSTKSSTSLTRYGHDRAEVMKGARGGEPEAEPMPETKKCVDEWEDKAQLIVSLVFMVLVGLSMPALIGKNAQEGQDGGLSAWAIGGHVIAVSIIMIIGKMFPLVCYNDESNVKGRLALCIGMCPRGEVGASIIVISLELGVSGPAVIISMCCLAGNLIMSGGFIAVVKQLLKGATPFSQEGEQVIQTPVEEARDS